MKNSVISAKILLLLIFSIFFINSALIAAEVESANKEKPKKFKRVQAIPPKDNYADVKGLREVVDGIKKAVAGKDADLLLKYVADDIKASFGGDDDKKAFIEMWNLKTAPGNSEIWKVLDEIFALGGTFDRDEKSYTAPYTFSAELGDLDAFEYRIVIGKNVKVRKLPSSKSEVIKSVDYEVVRGYNDSAKEVSEEINGETHPWHKVDLSSGETGYIYGKFVRSPIDYRISIEKTDKGWKMKYMVCGD